MGKSEKRFDTVKQFVPSFSYTFIQCAMLVVHYGFNKEMPTWVTWFPTIIAGVFIIIFLLIFLGVIIFAIIVD